MSNDPPDLRPPRAPGGLHWLPPVSLGADAARTPGEQELESYPADSSWPEHEVPEHQQQGPGLVSELVLTAIVALGVTLATCAALYAAGVFRTPSHQEPPANHSAPAKPGSH